MAFFDFLSGMGGGVAQGAYYAMWIVPLIVIFIAVMNSIRNKMIFKYPVRIFRIRVSGKVKESNHMGGYIGRKNSAPFFRIKTGKWYWGWWYKIDLTTTPKPEYFDEQNRVYYKQIDVNTFIQMKRTFLNDGKIVAQTPVESDVKYGAILSVQRIKDVLRTEPTWKKVLPYATVIFLGMILLAGYAILLSTKCP